jgi:hypothetical protein
MYQLAKVVEIQRLSPYAALYPAKGKVSQPGLVAASLLAVPPKDEPKR